MFSHLMLGSNDVKASHQFYDAMLGALGIAPATHVEVGGKSRYVWQANGMRLMVAQPRNGAPSTPSNGFTVGFVAASVEQLNAAHAAALAHGGVSIEDPPGWREGGLPRRYLAYVRDPAGHKLCLRYDPE